MSGATDDLKAMIADAEDRIRDLEEMKAEGGQLTETIHGVEQDVTDEAIGALTLKIQRWRHILKDN